MQNVSPEGSTPVTDNLDNAGDRLYLVV